MLPSDALGAAEPRAAASVARAGSVAGIGATTPTAVLRLTGGPRHPRAMRPAPRPDRLSRRAVLLLSAVAGEAPRSGPP